MAADELPAHHGLLRLDNPEIGAGPELGAGSYDLVDVAAIHAETIECLTKGREDPFWVIGMSMGGMIVSHLATTYRAKLPLDTRFLFIDTTANLPTNPAVPDAVMVEWATAKPGRVDDFRRILSPFFAPNFLVDKPALAETYFRYRALGENKQTTKAFFRQLSALRRFDGQLTFSKADPVSALFIHAANDQILQQSHAEDLKGLCPNVRHLVLPGLGHMANLEQPALFDPRKTSHGW